MLTGVTGCRMRHLLSSLHAPTRARNCRRRCRRRSSRSTRRSRSPTAASTPWIMSSSLALPTPKSTLSSVRASPRPRGALPLRLLAIHTPACASAELDELEKEEIFRTKKVIEVKRAKEARAPCASRAPSPRHTLTLTRTPLPRKAHILHPMSAPAFPLPHRAAFLVTCSHRAASVR